ncbi:MAG TPA: tetratricopeptide repeat protein [Pyrinomonadaceae bacterium]|nr:tetratricopeptide repeat protein [Pyrinomonadaceae bacterium]
MKRCPQCNRLETDDALAFCRIDGSPLNVESQVTKDELGTIRLDSIPVSDEAKTTILTPPNTNESLNAPTAATTVLSSPLSAPLTVQRRKSKLPWILSAVAILITVVLAACVYFLFVRKAQAPIQSIAVMPFVNESGNPDIEYLSDGMTDTLISSLSQLPNLTVKARSSVFRYKGKETNPQTLGRELTVQAILNGRVVQRGDQLTLRLELVDTKTENVIWSDNYIRKQADLVTLQSEIARDVSSKLKTRLSGVDEEKLVKIYTTNPEAYRLYLQGRFYWNKREEKDVRNAIDCFNRAIALDANYALAYAGLADSYVILSSFSFADPAEAIPKAREFANKALSIDQSLAEPHTALGLTMVQFEYDFAGAEREYKQAIALNPNYATAHQWYAELLVCAGRFDESAVEYQHALKLEPLSLPINWDYGRLLYNWRKFDEALTQYKKTIDLDPGFARVRRTLVELYRLRGDHSSASEEMARYFEVRGQPQLASLTRETFAKDGWTGFLRLVVAVDSPLKERSWAKAKAYVELGDKDKAFAELNSAYASHESSLCWLKVEPQFDSLRSDPRYDELLQKVGFSR